MLRIGIIFLKKLNPRFSVGGKQAVALWLAQALQNSHQITLLHLDRKINFEELNRIYGTSLANDRIKLSRIIEPGFLPSKFRLLKQGFLWRKLKSLVSDFDVLISAQGEIDLGKPLIQYIHFPSPSLFFLKKNRGCAKRFYYKLCNFISKRSLDSMKRNLTLTNSFYTGDVIESVYGMKSRVVYPPVVMKFVNKVLWQDRENGFILISRLSPEKKIEKVIEILQEVRKQKPNIHLHIIGSVQDKEYAKYLNRIVKKNQDWIYLEGILSQEDYFDLISRHKYGIHGMPGEHFGIGIAEMVGAGLIVFVPADGGQAEIVGDRDLVYHSQTEATEKILKIIGSDSLQQALLKKLKENSKKFNVEYFCQNINQIVKDFANSKI